MMSVIYLPEDKRWSLVGSGIGELVGTYVAQQLKQRDDVRVAQGLQGMMSNPEVKPQDQPLEAIKQYGVKGFALYNALVKQQGQQVLNKERTAQTELAGKRGAQIDQQMGIQQQTAPLQQEKLRGEV